ncbi:hypothetical protein FHP29_10585 [Nocardioides albidus]|uniref:Uncharacterized protein n=1 Tax=Nocardioides albidus TaxID=1517589 RepID=A0A5C4VZ25_9ACTN|nr:hypothetical protein [Nocardioides albidus]TNM40485.1 hypothetical protein FHP29_10585 [Nocardioides albidus]
MTDGPQTFDELVDKVEEKTEQMIDDLVDKANWAAGKLEDAANSVLAKLGRLIPGESEAEKAIDKWNDEIQPEIQKGINELRGKVARAVGELAGDPLSLIDYSKAYIAAKATLYQSTTLNQDIVSLGNTWEGPAYNAYSTVATEQSDALLALSNNLQLGGDLTRDGADRILQLWLDLITNYIDYATSAISLVGSFADVGKALGAWIPAIADAFALIIQKIGDVAVLLLTFWKNQVTQASESWEILTAGFDGLPNNHWPKISEGSSDDINNPAGWPS